MLFEDSSTNEALEILESNIKRLNASKPFGYDDIYNKLMDNFDQHRMHHAFLIHGIKGIGKKMFITYFVNELLKKEDNSGKLSNLFLSNSHPDMRIISNDNGEIGIDMIREVLDFLSLKPSCELGKIVIIDGIEGMNKNASNALLKCLEEPNGKTTFFLIAHDKSAILQTILSRCLQIQAPILNRELCIDIVKNVINDTDKSKIESVIDYVNCSPGSIINFIEHHWFDFAKDLEVIMNLPSDKKTVEIELFLQRYQDTLSSEGKKNAIYISFGIFIKIYKNIMMNVPDKSREIYKKFKENRDFMIKSVIFSMEPGEFIRYITLN